MTQNVLSVSQINEYIKQIIETDDLLSTIAVRGEISNYKCYPSGHHYFTIKDAESSLRCVMFRTSAVRLRFRPENGMQVIVMGRISVYPRDGAYQLYCTAMTPVGTGDLHMAFEQLKAKLAAQGLFDAERKKPLPKFPQRIGIITSSAGAAVHDILRILNKRYPIAEAKILPVRVQGEEAPGEIAAAIDYANTHKLADLLIVGRGGGSIEDLWAFNDEMVAQAIFRSRIPVISAVGHEPDVTISDFVADVRAATPSNGAELAVPDQNALRQNLDTMLSAITKTFTRQLDAYMQRLQTLSARPVLQNTDSYLKLKENELERLFLVLNRSYKGNLKNNTMRLITSASKLDALSPLKVLSRGYGFVQTGEGNSIHSVRQVKKGDHIRIDMHDGTLSADITGVTEVCDE